MKNLETSLILLAGCLLIVAGQYTKEYEEVFKQPAEECAECMGFTEECARTVYKHEKLTTTGLACLQYCAYNRKGVMNGTQFSSESDIVKVYKQVHAGDKERTNKATTNVRTCIGEAQQSSKTDPCKMAMTMQECFGAQ